MEIMTTTNTLFETLQNQGYLFYIRHPEFKGAGTMLLKEGKYTYMPEFRRSIELSENQVIELLNKIK
jgi:hypothetical protein